MKTLTWFNRAVALVAVSVFSLASEQSPQAGTPPEGFTALFNEKNLSGWWGLKTEDPVKWKALSPDKLAEKKAASIKDIAQHWSVNGEELVNDGHGLYLSTQKNYGDFEFLVDYKTVPKADSGIYLRGIPQVQIWDSTEEAKFNIGANKEIKNGMAVLDGKNFIGRIVDVNFFSSRILLVTDLNSKIPVISEPSGNHAILSGHGNSRPTLEYFSENQKIHENDIIYTSGKEGIFAPGIPIGEAKIAKDIIEVQLYSEISEITFVNINLEGFKKKE